MLHKGIRQKITFLILLILTTIYTAVTDVHNPV